MDQSNGSVSQALNEASILGRSQVSASLPGMRIPKKLRSGKKKGHRAHGVSQFIIQARSRLLPGFKRFRKISKLTRLSLADEQQRKIIAQSAWWLKGFYEHLRAWADEENWVVEEKHADNCDLNNRLLVLNKCSCTPLQKLIWNGDAGHIKSSHEILGLFEKAMGAGAVDEAAQTTPQPMAQGQPEASQPGPTIAETQSVVGASSQPPQPE